MATKSWGSTTGGSNGDKLDYMKFNNGKNVVRIVSGVLPRYVYWIQNKEGKPAPFECLRFDREKERFIRGASDPVHDMGFKDPEKKDGKAQPLRPKKNYLAVVIDRTDNKLKLMEVKATILTGIHSIMAQLNLEDPGEIDITISKSGTGFDTKYDVQQIAAMQFQMAKNQPGSKEAALHEADVALIGEALYNEADEFEGFEQVPKLDVTYPVPSYDEQKKAIQAWLEGKKDEEGDESKGNEGSANSGNIDHEAASDLD